MKPLTLLTGALAWAALATASAHTPYLSPSNFAPQAGETVALDAAFAETFFVPEAAFDNSRFVITGPDGGLKRGWELTLHLNHKAGPRTRPRFGWRLA